MGMQKDPTRQYHRLARRIQYHAHAMVDGVAGCLGGLHRLNKTKSAVLRPHVCPSVTSTGTHWTDWNQNGYKYLTSRKIHPHLAVVVYNPSNNP